MDKSVDNLFHKIKQFLPVVLVFVFALSIRLVAIQQKTSLFWDSPISIYLASQSKFENLNKADLSWEDVQELFEPHRTYTAYEVKKKLFENSSSFRSIVKDLKILRTSKMDNVHSNLYYSIARVWNAGVSGTDYHQIIKRNCALNLLFFCLSFFFMYKLLNLIKLDVKACSLGLLFAFATPGAVSTTLLIREYALMETFAIAVTYIFVVFYRKIMDYENATEINKIQVVMYSFAMALFLLSGYYSVVYVFILFSLLVIACIANEKYEILSQLLLIAVISIVITLLVHPNFFVFLLKNDHTQTIGATVCESIANSFTFFLRILNYSMCSIYLFLLSIFFILFPKILDFLNVKHSNEQISCLDKQSKLILYGLVVISFVCGLIIIHTAPYKSYRYLAPIFPVLSLLLLIIVCELKCYIQKPCTVLIVGFFVLSSISCFWTNSIGRILYMRTGDPYIPNRHVNIPVVFYNSGWSKFNYIMYLDDDVKVRFEKELPLEKKYDLDQYLMISDASVAGSGFLEKYSKNITSFVHNFAALVILVNFKEDNLYKDAIFDYY